MGRTVAAPPSGSTVESEPVGSEVVTLQRRVGALESRIVRLVAAIENIPNMLTSTQGLQQLLALTQGEAPAENVIPFPADKAQAQAQAQVQAQAQTQTATEPAGVQQMAQQIAQMASQGAEAAQAPAGADPQQVLIQQVMAAMAQGQQGGAPNNGGGGGGFLPQLLQFMKIAQDLGFIGGPRQAAGPSREDAQNDALENLIRTFEVVHRLESLTVDRMRATRLMFESVADTEDARGGTGAPVQQGQPRRTTRTRTATARPLIPRAPTPVQAPASSSAPHRG